MSTKQDCDFKDKSVPTESLADLQLTTEQAEETKAGTSFNSFGGFAGGVFVGSARGDEFDDIIVGAGPGAQPHVK